MALRCAQLAVVGLLVSILALAGCTIRPVYSGPGIEKMAWAFRYDEPTSRLGMVVRDELSVHFNPSENPFAPRIRISASQLQSGLVKTLNPGPLGNAQMQVNVSVRVYNDSGVIFTANRFATAYYQTNGQRFADNEAIKEAAERAAKSAAESIRLILLANFSKFQSDPLVIGKK